MVTKTNCTSLTEILSQILDELNKIHGDKFDIERVILVKLERMIDIAKSRLRILQKNGFCIKTPWHMAMNDASADTKHIS